MEVNEGTVDKTIRITAGLALIIIVGFGMNSWWGLLGLVPLATGIASRCPMYSVLGISTCKITESKKG